MRDDMKALVQIIAILIIIVVMIYVVANMLENIKNILETVLHARITNVFTEEKMNRLTERHTGVAVIKNKNFKDAAEKLAVYEEAEDQGLLLLVPCKAGDTVYELAECSDSIYRIFPMMVKDVVPYGAIRRTKGTGTTVWNMYLESDYTYAYKHFADIGKTVFLIKEDAEKVLERLETKYE